MLPLPPSTPNSVAIQFPLLLKYKKFRAWIFTYKGNVLAVILGHAATAIGLAVSSRVLTELVAPAALGQYKLAIGAIGLASGLYFRPFVQFVMRQYHDANERNLGQYFLAFGFRGLNYAALIFGIFITVALVFYGQVTGSLGLMAALAAAGLLYLHSFLNFQTGVLITQNRQKFANLFRTFAQCGIPFAAALGAVVLGQSGWSLLVAEAVFLLLVLAASTRWVPIRRASPTPAVDQVQSHWSTEARHFVTPLIGVGAFSWILSTSDRYILEAFCSTHEVGLYSAVYGLSAQPMQAVTGISAQLVYPFLFRAAAQKRMQTEAQIYHLVILTVAGAALLGIGALVLMGQRIVNLLLAPSYRENAYEVMLWVASGYVALSLASAIELKAYASKRTTIIVLAYIVAGLVNLGLNLFWIPQLGAIGAAKSTFFSMLVYLAILLIISFIQNLSRQESVGNTGG